MLDMVRLARLSEYQLYHSLISVRKLLYVAQGICEKVAKYQSKELKVFSKGYIYHIPFKRGTQVSEEGAEPKEISEDIPKIVARLENEKSVTSSQTAARKNEDRAKAEALRNASLGKLTTADKELIKSYNVVELEPSSAKKRPPNNSSAEMYRILGSSAERPKQRMEMKAQREFHNENRKNRRLELKAKHSQQQQVIELQKLEHAKQQQANELQKLELQTRASEALLQLFRRGRIKDIIRQYKYHSYQQ